MGNECESANEGERDQCIHHWFIDERNLGLCKKCGASKQFSSSWSAMSIQKSWGNRSGKVQPKVPGPGS